MLYIKVDCIFPFSLNLLNQLYKRKMNLVVVNSHIYVEERITNEAEDLDLLEAKHDVCIWFRSLKIFIGVST